MSPRLLPLVNVTGPHGSRSRATCHYRCGNACDKPMPNSSGNTPMHEIIAQVLSRRAVLGGAAVASGAMVLNPLLGVSPAQAATGERRRGVQNLTFTPVPPNNRDVVSVPPGYESDVVIRWGDRVLPGAPPFNVYQQTAAAQAQQFGYNCDYVGVLPIDGNPDHATLTVNHEYTNESIMFPPGPYKPIQVKRIAMMAHGMSVVEIKRGRKKGSWRRVLVDNAPRNRRITIDTTLRLTGPAAGHPRLRTSADPTGRRVLGTLNNCAGGITPWGTILSGEENFNQYFDASGELDPRYTESYERYGITGEDTRGWSQVDDRFDLTTEPHEPFRFGWIVELDPSNPRSIIRKRTMLGRFKHEGANVRLADNGRAVAYMGDDERGDYIYKFVSRLRHRPGTGDAAKRHNLKLLDDGTLYVARFDGDGTEDGVYDGTGVWIPLCSATKSFVEGMSVAEVLIDTRLAADTVSPTAMDRPEDIEPNLVTGKVYAALTNNSERGTTYPPDEANPITSSMVRSELGAPLTPASGNRNGYVLEWQENGNDAAARRFEWNLFLVCGDPDAPETYFGGYPKDRVSPISCPDNVAFDSAGHLWVSTDGNALGSNDGLFAVPTQGTNRGQVLQFLTVPLEAETCGPLISKDGHSVWVAVQHPGESDDATFNNQVSTWPHTNRFPRPSVVVTYRVDNQRIGV
ncbi:MAG: PhoX family phosphatase [Nocardioidaceae bacterium]|jgi:secreted PhoX family phosphatase|nr:PhoX family phosphatase [Nocardioidaceae bacterium]